MDSRSPMAILVDELAAKMIDHGPYPDEFISPKPSFADASVPDPEELYWADYVKDSDGKLVMVRGAKK